MKMMSKLVLATALCLFSAGMAMGAPTFDIDFYGGDTNLTQGVMDTDTNLSLAAGEKVSVNILMSGIPDTEMLDGYGYRLNFGPGLEVSALERDSANWAGFGELYMDNDNGALGIEGLSNMDREINGDDIALFSFELTATSYDEAYVLQLLDLDARDNTSTRVIGSSPAEINVYDLNENEGVNLASINADNPVPVPAAVWLLGSGLTSLLAIRRRKSLKQN